MSEPAKATAGPRISIVTPSLNQAGFLEETLRSVLDQNYPKLEYVVVDGASTDGTLELIRKYQQKLAWWTSEPDQGHYDALNKGFAHTTGEIMAWINSDDKYLPWTFSVVAEIMAAFPEIEWLTSRFHLFWDERGRAVRCEEHPGFSRHEVLSGGTLPGADWPGWAFLQQEATFWRRSLWERAGGKLETAYSLAGDFELWMRFAARAELYCADVPLAGFRQHPGQQTARRMKEYVRQAQEAFRKTGGKPPGPIMRLWLKDTAKLLRFFNRRHASAAGQQRTRNRVVFPPAEGKWRLERY